MRVLFSFTQSEPPNALSMGKLIPTIESYWKLWRRERFLLIFKEWEKPERASQYNISELWWRTKLIYNVNRWRQSRKAETGSHHQIAWAIIITSLKKQSRKLPYERIPCVSKFENSSIRQHIRRGRENCCVSFYLKGLTWKHITYRALKRTHCITSCSKDQYSEFIRSYFRHRSNEDCVSCVWKEQKISQDNTSGADISKIAYNFLSRSSCNTIVIWNFVCMSRLLEE